MNSSYSAGHLVPGDGLTSGALNPGMVSVRSVEVWQNEPITYSPLPMLTALNVLRRRTSGSSIRCASASHKAFLDSLVRWSGESAPDAKPFSIHVRVSSQLHRLREFVSRKRIGPTELGWRSPVDHAVGIVASASVTPRWVRQAQHTSIHGTFMALRFNSAGGARVYARGSSRAPCIAIPTACGDVVLIDPEPRRLMSDQRLSLMVESIDLMNAYGVARDNGRSLDTRYSGVILPVVFMRTRAHNDDLVGASFTGGKPATIGLAYEQISLSLDARGDAPAVVRGADFGAGVDFMVDRPFLLTIMRPGVQLPLVAGWYDSSCWQRHWV